MTKETLVFLAAVAVVLFFATVKIAIMGGM